MKRNGKYNVTLYVLAIIAGLLGSFAYVFAR
jgi:hypothetical protein